MKEKVPKSLAKAAAANMKLIKRYKPTKKERIDRIIEDHRKLDPRSDYTKEDVMNHIQVNMADKKRNEYCTVESFERSVFSLEGIRIVLRAPTYATVRRYPFRKRCSNDTNVHDFVEKRIKNTIDSTYQVYVVSDTKYSPDMPISKIRKYHSSNS